MLKAIDWLGLLMAIGAGAAAFGLAALGSAYPKDGARLIALGLLIAVTALAGKLLPALWR